MADYFIDGIANVKTILSKEVSLNGELVFQDSLEIHGEFTGSIRGKGLLVIGPSGIVKGNIYSKDLVVEGKVVGDILVYNRLSIESAAEVVGDITTHKIKVKHHAVIDGNCSTLDEKTIFEQFQKEIEKASPRKEQLSSDFETITQPNMNKNEESQYSKTTAREIPPSKKMKKK